MKKNKPKEQQTTRKPHRLSLSRETILVLHDPALLELARGGVGTSSQPADPTCGGADTSEGG